jgi:hypothetical protein
MKTTLGLYVAFVGISLMLWSGCFGHRSHEAIGVAAPERVIAFHKPDHARRASGAVADARLTGRPDARDSTSIAPGQAPLKPVTPEGSEAARSRRATPAGGAGTLSP